MVAWSSEINSMVMGFVRTASTTLIHPTRARGQSRAYRLASPGSVDLNYPTRFQYGIADGYTDIGGFGVFLYTQADVDANPGRRLAGTMYLAPASAFGAGVVPTPAQIRLNAARVIRGIGAAGPPDYLTAPGTFEATFFDPSVAPVSWEPNKKYWILIAPTSHTSGSSPASDQPVGDINVNGRALSFWTNRTPNAPKITSPTNEITALSGEVFRLSWASQDPDALASFPGDNAPTDFGDIAGFHAQYAPRTNPGDPEPTWTDLPIANADGTALGSGWYIEDSSTGNTGAVNAWKNRGIDVHCASSTAAWAEYEPNVAYLPAGQWQVRVRLFDYGHPLPNAADAFNFGAPSPPPLVDYTGNYTASNYPAANTSPWSTSIKVSVAEQVPAPIPLSPINGIAIVEGAPVTLGWQYRNTHIPPFAQAARVIEMRKAGDANWTIVNSDLTDSTTWVVSGFPLVSGNQYEWRVLVVDTSDVPSQYSAPGRFWVVPVPNSGEVIPVPSETVEGATLGCGKHRVMIYRRGGKQYVGEITNCSRIEWNRTRDEISDASIEVSGWGIDCGNLLATLEPWAHEVVIFRDNGYSVDRVWEGPINLLTYKTNSVTIQAKDIMAYAYRRIVKQAINDSGNSPTAGRSVVERAAVVFLNGMAPDDPNVLSYLHVITSPGDAKQYRNLPVYSRTVYEEIDDMAANAGLDYVAIGRTLLLWGTKHRIGTLPEFRDENLGESPIVSVYGMQMANVYAVSDGNGIYGVANRLNSEGKDPTYGLVEMLSSTWASESATEEGTYTQEGIEKVSESFAESAERSISYRYPVPVVVRVPDNTRLNPDTVVSINHLVPGVVIPLRSTATLREVRDDQKLDAVKVVEIAGEETITITMSPFSREDNAVEGEG